MLYVICYDIEQDKLRNRISRVLEGYGQRVQKSVFECNLDDSSLEKLLRQLSALFEPQTANSIRIYPLCSTCKDKAVGIGALNDSLEDKDYIFI